MQDGSKISAELLDKSSSAGDKDCSSNVGSIKEVERPSAQEAPRAGSLLDPEISYGGSARHKMLPKKPVANGFLRQPLQTESDVKENTGHLKLLLAKIPKEPVTAGYPGDPVADKKEQYKSAVTEGQDEEQKVDEEDKENKNEQCIIF